MDLNHQTRYIYFKDSKDSNLSSDSEFDDDVVEVSFLFFNLVF